MNLDLANNKIAAAHRAIKETMHIDTDIYVGVDLGTAYIVLVVISGKGEPIALEMEFAQVLKDGLVVDYMGACQIVKRLKYKLEERIGITLEKACIAVPPGTDENDTRTHQYVVESSGMEVISVVDEPSAANNVIQMRNGVIVDIGGGTTGLSILKDGEVIYTADEATGGTHLSLVIAGRYKLSFEDAEDFKKNIEKRSEVCLTVRPVFEKMATIVKRHIEGFEVNEICLVGGTCYLPNIESVFEKIIGIRTFKPSNPLLVTPLGIALNCIK